MLEDYILAADRYSPETLEKAKASCDPSHVAHILAQDPTLTDDQAREIIAKHNIATSWEVEKFFQKRGSRYERCRFGNYETHCDAQRDAVKAIQRVTSKVNVILFGPRGTGKDHLLCALSVKAIECGCRVTWRNTQDLFAEVRDGMNDRYYSECETVRELVGADLLYLSDILPPSGSLTEFQSAFLFRVLDGRYSHRKSVWVTVNVNSGAELDARLGPQNADRLRDGATAIYCNWPSYRKAMS